MKLAMPPDKIDSLEGEKSSLYEKLADPVFLRDASAILVANSRLASIEAAIAVAMKRWEALESIVSEG